jgi:nucleotide-binding universal stress UspA family protein
MYQTLLVPLDTSPLAEAALPHARTLAQIMRAKLVLLCVAAFPHHDYTALDPSHTQRFQIEEERIRQTTQDYLERIARELKTDGLTVSTELRGNEPVADAILATTDEVGADVIVMSTHGRSGISRWLIGSIADKIVHSAKVPVLLIRSKPQEASHV